MHRPILTEGIGNTAQGYCAALSVLGSFSCVAFSRMRQLNRSAFSMVQRFHPYGILDSLDDLVIPCAPAQVAGDRLVDFVRAGFRILLQQLRR
jgi:hypothetical protein